MATVKEITHDSSTVLSDFYSSISNGDGAITVKASAELGGSVNGVEMDYDAGVLNLNRIREGFTFVAPSEFRWRFRVDLGGITNNNAGDTVAQMDILTALNSNFMDIDIDANAGDSGFTLTLSYFKDGTGLTTIGTVSFPSSGDICVDVSAIKETADGNNDGEIELFLNGVSKLSISNAENFNNFSPGTLSTNFRSNNVNITGTLKYDEVLLTDVSAVSLCIAALSLASMAKPADIDASSEFIYVALLSGGTPILTKISTALDADGVTVFNPGAGTNIGVQCGRFNPNVVWVAGNFDGTNVVELSQDAGSSFIVADDGTIGDVRSFVLGPDKDNRILVFDETNGDILETTNDGDTWTNINASVTPEVNAIGRLGENVQEAVFGNDGAANDSIDYSVNSGDDLEDFQTGVYPNANATGIIVN